jgi:hypothetical protein
MPDFAPSLGSIKGPYGETIVSQDGVRPTYCVAVTAVTPAATPTDVVVLPGSASKIVKIRRIIIGGIAGTAGTMIVNFVRRSTAATGGTATTPTPTKFDSADPAATAVLQQFSANPTVGTSAGIVYANRIFLNLTTALNDRIVQDFVYGAEPHVLRGTGEFFAINFAGATVPASGVIDYAIYWTEE